MSAETPCVPLRLGYALGALGTQHPTVLTGVGENEMQKCITHSDSANWGGKKLLQKCILHSVRQCMLEWDRMNCESETHTRQREC